MINVQKDRMTAAQAAIFVWALAIAFALILFFFFVMRPAHSRVVEIRDRVEMLENRLKWVTNTVDSLQEPVKVFDYFVGVDRDLARRFPDSAERSLIAIADYANKFGVRIERVEAEKPAKVVNADGLLLGAEGKTCMGVPVSFRFKSEYDNLVKYLEALRRVLPAFLVVKNIAAENNFSTGSRIEGRVEMTLYLLE
jgi:hypothetical protein